MTFIASIIYHVVAAARVMVPTFGIAAVLVMSRQPELWAATEPSGSVNWLPFVAIGCLIATLIGLLKMRA
jgi:hypothetical protein